MTRLQVAPGDGLLVRLAHAALFLPAADSADELVAAFGESSDGGAIDAVTSLADVRELDVPSFVVAEWDDVLRLAVFGPVEVTSDHRSLARLSGAGSATWVERTVRAGHVRIEVTADNLHEASDVRLGTVAAGGFALTLTLGGRAGSVAPERPRASPSTDPPTSPSTTPPTSPSTTPPTSPSTNPPRARDPLSPRVSPGSADASPSFDVAAFDAPAGRDDPTIDVPSGFTGGYRPATVSEPVTGPITEQITVPMVDQQTVPGRWSLRFADGPVEAVDCTLVVGRRPTEGDAGPKPVRLVQIDCPQMSARHLTVWADAVGLWVTDLNSRNRSWVVTSGDHRLVALEPNVATRLEHGTHVQIGTKVFVVERG